MNLKSINPLLGAHVSAAGGLINVIKNAELIGAECVQIHATSPRQWIVKLPKEEDVLAFKNALKESTLKQVFIHAPYLINLASPDPVIHKKSIDNLMGNMEIAEMIGAEGVVFHLGSAKDGDRQGAFQQQLEAINYVLKNHQGNSKIILENSAGGGNKFGATLEDIGMIINASKSKRLAVCYDTAHAGLIPNYEKSVVKKLWDDFDKLIGLDKLVALHVNDSKTEFASNHDRHANLGDGYLGIDAFKNLADDKRLHDKAWILEVPGDGEGPTKQQLDLLKSLF
jgi:deoxyribonuclease-4